MDFLDNKSDSTSRRSQQIRSWYLYEQYKSLERNQIDAARRLSEKTSQNKMLHHELSEHRQRRRMCSGCHSEPSIDFIRHNDSQYSHSCATCSINDLFESFCQDDEFTNADDADAVSIQESCRWSQDDKEPSPLSDQLKNTNASCEQNQCEDSSPLPRTVLRDTEQNRDSSSSSNIPDDIEQAFSNYDDKDLLLLPSSCNLTEDRILLSASSSKLANDDAFLLAVSNSNLADDIKQELEYVKRNIVENIHVQLEMKENVQSLEDFTKFQDSNYKKASLFDDNKVTDDGKDDVLDKNKNSFALWAKLVSFAYQVVQLNHGNVLQPYVSPIEYVNNCTWDHSNSTNTIKKARYTNTSLSQITKKSKTRTKDQRKHKRSRGGKSCSCVIESLSIIGGTASGQKTDNMTTFDNSTKMLLQNEGWQSISTYPSVTLPSEKYSSTWHTWHEELNSKGSELNSCSTRITNPMLNIATYIDSVLQDVGKSNL